MSEKYKAFDDEAQCSYCNTAICFNIPINSPCRIMC